MVGVTLCWLVFSIVVGIIADQRGRSGLGWGFLAAMISPLLAGVILFVLPNIAEELAEEDKKIQQRKRERELKEKENQEKPRSALTISSAYFVLSIDRLHQLHERKDP